MKKNIQLIALMLFASVGIFAQKSVDHQIITEKYDQISRLETYSERREFLNQQSPEIKVALWNENIDRKTANLTLSVEQKEILNLIKTKFNTVEYAASIRGKSEADAGAEYKDAMAKANQLFGKDLLRELFGILGDSKTLKK